MCIFSVRRAHQRRVQPLSTRARGTAAVREREKGGVLRMRVRKMAGGVEEGRNFESVCTYGMFERPVRWTEGDWQEEGKGRGLGEGRTGSTWATWAVPLGEKCIPSRHAAGGEVPRDLDGTWEGAERSMWSLSRRRAATCLMRLTTKHTPCSPRRL